MTQIARQHWSAKRYAETAHFVPTLSAPVLELLAPAGRERILDLGCGDGVLSEKIAAAGVAVDAGPDMVAAAQSRGIDARVMDGQRLTFCGEFDAVFSNAALHWMRDQEMVLAGVSRALKPGGRFVAEMGGHNNTAAIIVALSAVLARRGIHARRLNPWYFPSADAYRKKLEAAGFTVENIAIIPRPTTLPAGLEAWLDTFAEDFLGAVPAQDRMQMHPEVTDLLRPVLMDETGTWIADYVRLRFFAIRLAWGDGRAFTSPRRPVLRAALQLPAFLRRVSRRQTR
jgi:SAM-dependent methyltransferase